MRRGRERRLRRVTWAAIALNAVAVGIHAWEYGTGGAASHGALAVAHCFLVSLLVPTVGRRGY